VEGAFRLLECCRAARVARFLQISTDEVYGSLGAEGRFSESDPLAPNSPYAATKASADLLVLADVRTHGTPALITRCSNNYGPYQFPEKFIPLMIAQAAASQPLPVYGDGRNIRDWIHVEDHCRAIDLVLRHGREGQIYNIGGDCEMENLEVACRILDALGQPRSLVRFVADRPGHDRRYAINCQKIKSELHWGQRWTFEAGLAATIRWYQENAGWLDEVRSGAYREYFARHYQDREATLARLKPSSAGK
jgi:dTDP-glucose 4,6-dehydratase